MKKKISVSFSRSFFWKSLVLVVTIRMIALLKIFASFAKKTSCSVNSEISCGVFASFNFTYKMTKYFKCKMFERFLKILYAFCDKKIQQNPFFRILFLCYVRGRSQTTLTRFCHFWPPTPLCWQFLWYERWQKVDIFGPPTYLVL